MRRLFCAFAAAMALLWTAALAEPYDIVYEKAGGGQYIYCNNPEFVTADMLCKKGNPNAQYLMNNDALAPGDYTLFLCFTNMTGTDVEPDVEFKSSNGAKITVTRAGYYVPNGNEYWDCLGAWADYLRLDIVPGAQTEQYVHYSGAAGLPKVLDLAEGRRWASECIYNYTQVAPQLSFNMLLDFSIEGGEADVNCGAIKHGERGAEVNLRRAAYVSDTAIKGISDTLPIVEAKLDIEITPEQKDGKNLVMRVFNNYFPDGNIVPYWITNINPARDGSAGAVSAAALSDMLAFEYADSGKNAYGAEDGIWHIDTDHYDTAQYREDYPWSEEEYEPNTAVEGWDLKNPPRTDLMFNLGNFGVTNRHYLTLTNSDSRVRCVNYYIESASSSNIVVVRSADGTALNPYTLMPEGAFAQNKSITPDEQTSECFFSVELAPGEVKSYILDVILPTNTFGGQKNYFTVTGEKALAEPAACALPVYDSRDEWQRVFYTGAEYMRWEGERLMRLEDGEWREVKLGAAARDAFADEDYEITMVRTDSGYAAKYSAWDGMDTVGNRRGKNRVYFLDNDMDYVSEYEFGDYIYNMVFSDHTLYVQADAFYQSEDNSLRRFIPIEDATILPAANGSFTLLRRQWPYYRRSRADGSGRKIVFEGGIPQLIYATDGLFYYKKSFKERRTDADVKNILSVSADGISWVDLELPDRLLELLRVYRADGKIIVVTRYESFEFDDVSLSAVTVMINGEYFSFEQSPEIREGRIMVPLRFLAEQIGAEVLWDGDTGSIEVRRGENSVSIAIGSDAAHGGEREYKLDAAPYIKGGKAMVPLRFLSAQLGCRVRWVEKTRTVKIIW